MKGPVDMAVVAVLMAMHHMVVEVGMQALNMVVEVGMQALNMVVLQVAVAMVEM
jgi:hypothetical protein